MQISAYLDQLAKLPYAGLDSLGGGSVTILAPHPDDEALGTGGLIAACLEAGIHVSVVVLTDGAGSHPSSKRFPKERLIELRRQECQSGLAILGLSPANIVHFGLSDTAAPMSGTSFDQTVQRLSELVTRSGSTSLFVTWDKDPHCDHLAAARIAGAVGRSIPGLLVWHYPIWGWYLPDSEPMDRPSPDGFRFDISPWIDLKHRAIAAHASQMTKLIDDDPQGFTFSAEKLHRFLQPTEYFIRSQQ
ncbi:PIG-L deacetylase family protein [Labrys portucalensis]|uniref:PIG-L deacetylase family protein n=1 Tax=Labrys neptuniae TaxID=376174 RepID=A0ABV6ZQH9_9HYPH